MKGLGWFDGQRFASGHSQAPLFRAIARYHAFLDLMAVKGASFLVPTLVRVFVFCAFLSTDIPIGYRKLPIDLVIGTSDTM